MLNTPKKMLDWGLTQLILMSWEGRFSSCLDQQSGSPGFQTPNSGGQCQLWWVSPGRRCRWGSDYCRIHNRWNCFIIDKKPDPLFLPQLIMSALILKFSPRRDCLYHFIQRLNTRWFRSKLTKTQTIFTVFYFYCMVKVQKKQSHNEGVVKPRCGHEELNYFL